MKGRRYPLGIQTFKNVIEENYIYVDITWLGKVRVRPTQSTTKGRINDMQNSG